MDPAGLVWGKTSGPPSRRPTCFCLGARGIPARQNRFTQYNWHPLPDQCDPGLWKTLSSYTRPAILSPISPPMRAKYQDHVGEMMFPYDFEPIFDQQTGNQKLGQFRRRKPSPAARFPGV